MTIEEALHTAVAEAARGQIRVPPDLHGFPGTAHGGAVAALFHRLALPRPPVSLRLELTCGVPTDTPLRLLTGSTGQAARLSLAQGDRPLAEATLSRGAVPAIDPATVASLAGLRATAHAPHDEVPRTATCLACGAANPVGVGLRLLLNEHLVWRECTPPPGYRTRDGWTHPALAMIALDELGWWLGALAHGECGVTTEVAITLVKPIPFAPLFVVGDRRAVHADADPRGRFCRARGYLLTSDGDPLAMGEVRFAGSRAYTRRLVGPFLETTTLDRLTRIFPSAREVGHRDA